MKYRILLSFSGLAGIFLLPTAFIFATIPVVYSIIRILKARSNIKKGLPIEKPTMKNSRRRIMFFYGSTCIILLLLLISIIVDAFFIPQILVYAFLGPGFGVIVGLGIRYYIKKKARKKGDSFPVILVAGFIVIVFIYTIVPFIIEGVEETYIVTSIPEGYPIITIDEISKKPSKTSTASREFKRGCSPITPKHYSYWEYGNEESLNIRYYKTINPKYAEIIFNGIRDDLEKGFKWEGMTIFDRTIISDEEMKDLWDVDNLVLTQERDIIIIQKGTIVLRILGDIDFSDKQIRELIISRFFFRSFLRELTFIIPTLR